MKVIPLATYRLQFNGHFTFAQATELVEYFHQLGVSHCYASPLLKAKKGSIHGYDIVGHDQFNPEIGTENEFENYVKVLRQFNMGLIFDIVPNHMYIFDAANKWWNDILENGPASQYAEYFDIDWHPPRPELANKVLLPLLDRQYGEALEEKKLKLIYRDGAFFLQLPFFLLPTDPKSWNLVLGTVEKKLQVILPSDHLQFLELQSIITALSHLPSTTETRKEKAAERLREKEIIKQRLGNLLMQSQAVLELLLNNLDSFNSNLEELESFIKIQPYRLCYWRVANDEINYRRFFDIPDLAGIRMEKQEVFEAVHAKVFDLIQKQMIDGLRIDHIDGLWDPEQYLCDLQKGCQYPLYTIAEKILIGSEKLLKEWPLNGTVGYDFLNQLNGIYIYQPNVKALNDTYKRFARSEGSLFNLIYSCKALILLVSLSGELFVLTKLLDHISQQHRSSRDFTLESLRSALRDVISCFPVYRSYIRVSMGIVHNKDRENILKAVSRAKRLNPAVNASIFNFIQSVLLLEYPQGLSDAQKAERGNFVMRFQQLSAAVMAKGLEDTAFYRHYPLISAVEVGNDPYILGLNLDAFHKKNRERVQEWPHSMLATSTHDTKRGEDVRARINVLSEIAEEWEQALSRWSHLNLKHKVKEGEELIPDANEEYLLYQTLIGTWPLQSGDSPAYLERIQKYMQKALNEAKIHTSWVNPNEEYNHGMRQFIEKILDPQNEFLKDFTQFIPKISAAGLLNSLSQVIIKLTSPGIPDIYQGNEIWTFELVDPDNRHPVDFQVRKKMLKEMMEQWVRPYDLIRELMKTVEDGRIKMFATVRVLNLRRRASELFSTGVYIPLTVQGEKQDHIVAFARVLEGKAVIVVAARFFTFLMKEAKAQIDPMVWNSTQVILPEELTKNHYCNVFTDQEISLEQTIDLEQVFSIFPFAILEKV